MAFRRKAVARHDDALAVLEGENGGAVWNFEDGPIRAQQTAQVRSEVTVVDVQKLGKTGTLILATEVQRPLPFPETAGNSY
jgi:hypothetical protein